MRHPDDGTGQRPGRLPGDGHLDEGTIHAWLDGALDAAESARVERHAATCEACSAMVAEARGLVAAASRILTRLDDVPAGVVPAGTAAASAAAVPTPASVGPRLARKTTDAAAGRRRRWAPTVWTISAAAAAVLMAVLVTGDEAERLLDQPMPASASDAALRSNEPEATPPVAEQAELPGAAFETAAPPAPAPGAGSATGRKSAESVPTPKAAAGEERTASALTVVAPTTPAQMPPPAVANEGAQLSERRAGGFVPRASDAPAPAQVAVPEQLRGRVAGAQGAVGAAVRDSTLLRADAPEMAADFQIAEVPAWSDSLTRARLPRRIGFGRRILSGARLLETSIVATADTVERRSVYALEDGSLVTLVEGPSTVRLEAVMTTGVDAAPPAAQAAPQERERQRAAAPALRQEAAKALAPADSAIAPERTLGETIIVRPDGTARLEWRDDGTALALEGRLSLDRLRALRDRVQH